GDSLRVIAQLTDAVSLARYGSWEWNRAVTGPVAEDVSVEIARNVRIALGSEIRRRELEAGASSQAALELYRTARSVYQEEATADWTDDPMSGLALLDQADSLLAEAERLDSGWPAPPILRSRIADDRSLLSGRLGHRRLEDLDAAIDHANRALATGRDSAVGLEQRGRLYFTMAEYAHPAAADSLLASAERDLRSASRLADRPGALLVLSDVLKRQGRLNAAHRTTRRAVEADAYLEFGSEVLYGLTMAALQLEDIEEADALARVARRRFPEDPDHVAMRLLILAARDSPADRHADWALAAADTVAALNVVERQAEWRAYARMMAAPTLARAGLRGRAEDVIRESRELLAELNPALLSASAYYEAYARLHWGQRDSVTSLLQRYTEGYPARARSLRSDWWFRELWDDPRYQRLAGDAPALEAAATSDR
ncbi:MAG: hypothetical protein ACOCUW_00775, partial [Gemmatimonadota bacterium]